MFEKILSWFLRERRILCDFILSRFGLSHLNRPFSAAFAFSVLAKLKHFHLACPISLPHIFFILRSTSTERQLGQQSK